MTVTPTGVADAFTGDGSTTAFVTTFVFGTSADIEVIERIIATGVESTKALTTDYTVSGGGGSGAIPATGTVTAVVAPASTVEWHLRRIVANTQTSALPTAGKFPAATVESMSDVLTMIAQQIDEAAGRAVSFPKSDDSAISNIMDNSVDRASKLLAFTSTGALTVRALSDGGTGTMSNLSEDDTPQLGGPLDTNGQVINESEATAVASAATTNIWATDGNTIHVTGTTSITSFGTAPRVGAWRKVIFDGALTLTDGANLNNQGGADITTATDDIAFVYAETLTLFKVLFFPVSGKPVVTDQVFASQAQMESESGSSVIPAPNVVKYHPGVAKAHIYFEGDAATPDSTKVGNNIGTIVDNGTGSYTCPFVTNQSTATYTAVVNGGTTTDGTDRQDGLDVSVVDLATGSFRIDCETQTPTQVDSGEVGVAIFGDF